MQLCSYRRSAVCRPTGFQLAICTQERLYIRVVNRKKFIASETQVSLNTTPTWGVDNVYYQHNHASSADDISTFWVQVTWDGTTTSKSQTENASSVTRAWKSLTTDSRIHYVVLYQATLCLESNASSTATLWSFLNLDSAEGWVWWRWYAQVSIAMMNNVGSKRSDCVKRYSDNFAPIFSLHSKSLCTKLLLAVGNINKKQCKCWNNTL